MDPELIAILVKARELFYQRGVRNVPLSLICTETGISSRKLQTFIRNKTELVTLLLEYERFSFERIFSRYNFDGVNSIDILLTVSREISSHFQDISPSLTIDLKKYYPDIYQKHMENRIEFIYSQMLLNLQKGIRLGIYRSDLSVELIARLYMRRLIDLHNPDFFPPDQFSFQTFFDVMFDNFIRGIATEEGIRYYEVQMHKDDLIKPSNP